MEENDIYIEDFLEKRKPDTFLAVYYKRYCKIVKEGPAFVYAINPEDIRKGSIQGKIDFGEILEIALVENDDKKFEIVIQGRIYEFRASTAQTRTKWVQALNKVLKQTMKEGNNGLLKGPKPLNLNIPLNDDQLKKDKLSIIHPGNVVEDADMYIEGYLEKKKPKAILFSFYDTRYCKIVKEGPAFVYGKNPEEIRKGITKGKIDIRDVLDIESLEDDDRKFDIIVKGRVYGFCAETAQECAKWVQALKKISKQTMKGGSKFLKDLKALHPGITLEVKQEDDDQMARNKFSILQPVSVVGGAVKDVVVEGALFTAVGLVKSGVRAFFADEKQRTNKEYLAAKNFEITLNKINPQLLQSRYKMGMLLREVKDLTGVGIVDSMMNNPKIREVIQRRWCFIISSKPLFGSQVDPRDEATLVKDELPIQLDFDTLYLYDESCDNSGPIEQIAMKNVLHIVIKEMFHGSEQYQFTLDLGEKKFNLICSSFDEIKSWLQALQAARATVAEVEKSREALLKNIFWVIKIKDGKNGERNLAQKIENNYSELTRTKDNSIKSLIQVQEKVATEFIGVINACLASRVPRNDIIEMYRKVYHENILATIQNCFDKKGQELECQELLEMIKFLNWYINKLSSYGTDFVDVKIKEALDSFITLFTANLLDKQNLKAIKNILDKFLESPINFDASGRATSQNPKDIFEILYGTLKATNYYSGEEFILELLEICQKTLECYQNGIDRFVEDSNLINEKLVAICNDAAQFVIQIKEFVSVAQQLLPTNQKAIFSHFNDIYVSSSFVIVGEKSCKKLIENLLLLANIRERKFIDLDLRLSLESVIQKAREILDQIHPASRSRLTSEITKRMVQDYTKSFVEFFENNWHKKADIVEIKTRLGDAPKIFFESFRTLQLLKDSEIEKIVSSVNDLSTFIKQENELLYMSLNILKRTHKDLATWSVILQIIKFLTKKAPKKVREKVLASCKEAFKKESEQEKEKQPQRSESYIGGEELPEKVEKCQRSESLRMIGEILATEAEASFQFGNLKSKSFCETGSNMPFVMEGVLEMELNLLQGIAALIGNRRPSKRYCSLRNDKIFCFQDKKAEKTIMTFNLKEAMKCDSEGSNSFILTIVNSDILKNLPHWRNEKTLKEALEQVTPNFKDHKLLREWRFTSNNQRERDKWVKTINSALKTVQEDEEGTMQSNNPNFEIYRDISVSFDTTLFSNTNLLK